MTMQDKSHFAISHSFKFLYDILIIVIIFSTMCKQTYIGSNIFIIYVSE